ncbi:MAG TPA: DUF4350 domain-containing protein [Aggregatilineales bacterium]|nr:DUF4350 domain-containing protein [Aggregatilineales bacterium]
MKKLPPDVRILVAVVAAIVFLSVVSVATAPAPQPPPLSVHNSGPDGAMALQMWIAQSGYAVRELITWTQLSSVDVLFLLDPSPFDAEQDGVRLRNWVSGGHVLIIASESPAVNTLLNSFDLALEYQITPQEAAFPSAPTLHQPPFDAAKADTYVSVKTSQPSAANHLYVGDRPVLVSQEVGKGRIWLSSALRPFTNQGLHDPGNARLLANLLANVPPTAIIGFDESRTGAGAADTGAAPTLGAWLFTSAPGLGILLGFGLTLAYLASRGRRFGRALPLPDERQRRESVEYIHAIATLSRRSGQRGEALKHLDQQLRRRLSERYGVDPRLEGAELVKAVVYRDPTVDEGTLAHLLKILERPDISEHELVIISSELDHFVRTIS